jgi:hypothetical protein
MTTGKYFEGIIEMLNYYRSEAQTFSALGLSNITKHSENFLKRILNLIYNYELENLNKGKSNYPGLDLGDTGEGIAFQITATKKSEKIDDTLATCIKYKHYEIFKRINVFILTSKQSSYTVKTVTEPYLSFSSEKNIMDFNDLFKEIEHLDPARMKAMYEYIKTELLPVIESIRDNKPQDEKYLIDKVAGMVESRMPYYSFWKSRVTLKTENISVPEIHSNLNAFLPTLNLKNQYLPIFNEAFRESYSNKQILYLQKLKSTNVQNYFYGNAMLLEPCSITTERIDYTNHEILSNLLQEMLMALTCILFFSKRAKGNFEIEVSITMETNGKVYFIPTNSLVLEQMSNSFTLDSPFKLIETITNVHVSTLTDLLQKIIHGFICLEPGSISNEPFLVIKRNYAEFVIDNIKKELGINDYPIL